MPNDDASLLPPPAVHDGPPPPEPPDSPPYVSLCVICGDEGADGLDRLFRSVLDRSSGPMFDEVSVYWNGSADKKPACLAGPWKTIHGFEVPLVVSDGPWKKDFAWARQISFEQAHGVFRGYLDSDDVAIEADDQAIDHSLAASGTTRAQLLDAATLRRFLQQMPVEVNAIRAPYHYTTIEGLPATITPRTRFVRWADGWVWQRPVHEDLFPIAGNQVRFMWVPSLVFQHHPLRPDKERLDRNAEILKRVEAEAAGRGLDHRTLFELGTMYFDLQDDTKAGEYLLKAVQSIPSPPPQDLLLYRALLAQACGRQGRFGDALENAAWGMLAMPEEPTGYLEMGRALYHLGNYGAAVHWFREGFRHKESAHLSGLQSPMTIQGHMRALGAHALLAIGQRREAYEWAQTGAKHDPGLFPARTLALCQDVVDGDETLVAYLKLADHLASRGETAQLRHLAHALPALLEGRREVQASTDRAAVAEAAAPVVAPDPDPATEVPDAGSLGVDHQAAATAVGDSLLKALDPIPVLATAEARTAEPVLVLVPDGSRPGARRPDGARTIFTPERLLHVLRPRGVVQELRSRPVPSAAGMETAGHVVAARYVPGPRAGPRSVAIWCPHYVQPWGPDDPEMRGTGGSEEAAVYLSRELALRGYDVTVYAPLPNDDLPLRVADGVLWRPLATFDPGITPDHLIMHRAPWGPQTAQFGARYLWTWHHDHWYAEEYWSPKLAGASRHLYVSNWQRRVLEGLLHVPTRGATIYNGIPPAQFAKAQQRLATAAAASGGRPVRNPRGVAYASMPTRGLDRLVDLWPDVRRLVPDAVLYLYYGFQTTYQLWRGHVDNLVDKLGMLDTAINDLTRQGIAVNRGRVGQNQLTDEFLQLGVLAYPSGFPEVYMIAAARAVAAGMRVVASNTGSLHETLPNQTYLVGEAVSDRDWATGGRERFLEMLVRALTEPEETYDRAAASAAALNWCSWERVAGRVATALAAAEAGDESAFLPGSVPIDGIAVERAGARIPVDPNFRRSIESETIGLGWIG